METIIQKAAKGSRAAMTELYEKNAAAVYCLANALMRGSAEAVPAANWGIKSAFQAAERGVIESEGDFTHFGDEASCRLLPERGHQEGPQSI